MKLVHNSFSLNSVNYSQEKLLNLASHWLSSAHLHEREIAQFFIEWFSENDEIIVTTSGSTGIPKKIVLKKCAMIASAEATGSYFNLQPNQTALLCLSANYIAGKMMLVRALVLGLKLDIVEVNSNPLENITKTYHFCAMVPMQVSNSLQKLELIKTVIIGGATISRDLQNDILKMNCSTFETYGMTETISHIAVKRVGEEWFECLPNVTIEKNEENCLVIFAPRIVAEPIITNDLVEIQVNSFKWLGRKDNTINSGGIKFQPEVIEKKLEAFISKPFYISSKKDSILGEKLVLVVESNVKLEVNFQNLEKFEIPKEIIYQKEFQKTSNGKLKRERF